ncbi:porphobilinogen deaminase [Culex quinquefasciatus]|uniref:hydroxymethylbilane synthase n=1 Tax=Culex quinquefasciatus TaxID=7176 RepID=B0WMK9_CULQU|nr:porphobilinogen deaminase [Culex quinquefasciatus]|eukprot:XP_001849943.1 porphobilinogen deaminase [Culex quinquefasciatus]
MFKKCPYSSEIEKLSSVESNELVESGKCDDGKNDPSATFPVGVDFMGDCPYVSTEQKVDQSGQSGLKCPVSGKLPLEQTSQQDAGLSCPFLAQQAKILDYNENLEREIVAPKLESTSEHLFCGMFRHKHVAKEIFDECEQTGIRLAQDLIGKGALEVMKCAQNEIHSKLALIQTKYVISCLQKLNPDVVYEIRKYFQHVHLCWHVPSYLLAFFLSPDTMTTVGDRVLNKSLPKIGEKSLFTKDLEDALRTGGVDFVVHSLKDLPTALPLGMAIGAVLERDDPRDALVLNEAHRGRTLSTLPKGSVVGTSSLRRSAQLARKYENVVVCDIRGNLNTRLAKLDADGSKFAGIILAQAGLVRMGWNARVSQVIEPGEILYAVGQGALAVECRSNDEYILDMLSKLCHLETQCKILKMYRDESVLNDQLLMALLGQFQYEHPNKEHLGPPEPPSHLERFSPEDLHKIYQPKADAITSL